MSEQTQHAMHVEFGRVHFSPERGSSPPSSLMHGELQFRWLKDQDEPPAFVLCREACLAEATVDAHDPYVGNISARVSEFEVRYFADRRWFEANVHITAWSRETV